MAVPRRGRWQAGRPLGAGQSAEQAGRPLGAGRSVTATGQAHSGGPWTHGVGLPRSTHTAMSRSGRRQAVRVPRGSGGRYEPRSSRRRSGVFGHRRRVGRGEAQRPSGGGGAPRAAGHSQVSGGLRAHAGRRWSAGAGRLVGALGSRRSVGGAAGAQAGSSFGTATVGDSAGGAGEHAPSGAGGSEPPRRVGIGAGRGLWTATARSDHVDQATTGGASGHVGRHGARATLGSSGPRAQRAPRCSVGAGSGSHGRRRGPRILRLVGDEAHQAGEAPRGRDGRASRAARVDGERDGVFGHMALERSGQRAGRRSSDGRRSGVQHPCSHRSRREPTAVVWRQRQEGSGRGDAAMALSSRISSRGGARTGDVRLGDRSSGNGANLCRQRGATDPRAT